MNPQTSSRSLFYLISGPPVPRESRLAIRATVPKKRPLSLAARAAAPKKRPSEIDHPFPESHRGLADRLRRRRMREDRVCDVLSFQAAGNCQ